MLTGSDSAPTAARAKALDGAGVMAMELGQVAVSRAYHEAARRLYAELGDQLAIAGNLEHPCPGQRGARCVYVHEHTGG